MGLLRNIAKLSVDGTRNNPKKDKRAYTRTDTFTLIKRAYIAGVSLFVCATVQLVITLIVPVAASANTILIYLRNGTSITCFMVVGLFLINWCYFQFNNNEEPQSDKTFKFIALIAMIMFFLKGVFSVYLVYYLSYREYYVLANYISEVVAWIMLGIFFAGFYNFAFLKSGRWKNIRPLIVACTIIALLKTLLSFFYALLYISLSGISWIYFLTESVAWLSISIYCSLYSGSFRPTITKHHKVVDNADFDDICDRIAKNN